MAAGLHWHYLIRDPKACGSIWPPQAPRGATRLVIAYVGTEYAFLVQVNQQARSNYVCSGKSWVQVLQTHSHIDPCTFNALSSNWSQPLVDVTPQALHRTSIKEMGAAAHVILQVLVSHRVEVTSPMHNTC